MSRQPVTITKEAMITAGRQLPYPFVLALPDNSELICEKSLRILPGKRLTIQGTWKSKHVVAKIFIHPFKAKYHLNKDKKGILAVHEQKLNAPNIYFAGESALKGVYVIIFEFLSSAKKIKQTWEEAQDIDSQNELISKLVHTFARQHAAGLYQEDLHLNNFLLRRGRIYCLDGDGIKYHKKNKPLNLHRSFGNLALFIENLTNYNATHVKKAFIEYCAYRSIPATDKNYRSLLKQMRSIKKRIHKVILDKTLRDCSSFVSHQDFKHFCVYDRTYDTPNFRAMMQNPERIFKLPGIEYLKKGNTCTIIRAVIDGRDLVIKRYNIKNIWHGMERLFRQTRARRSWLSAHHLQLLDINVMKPIGLFEKRWGPYRLQAYFISEFIPGKSLAEILSEEMTDFSCFDHFSGNLINQLLLMHDKNFTHGDLKSTNLHLKQSQMIFLDLDTVTWHKNSKKAQQEKLRDINRFLENFSENPPLLKYWQNKIEEGYFK